MSLLPGVPSFPWDCYNHRCVKAHRCLIDGCARIPDKNGHIWDGEEVCIHSLMFATCSRCGADPTEQRVTLHCP